MDEADEKRCVTFWYRNYRGKESVRHVLPIAIRFGTCLPWYKEEQWLLEAFDVDKGADRTFAIRNITWWGPV